MREERTRKRKRVETVEELSELAPTVVFDEGTSSEEREEYETYVE